MEVPGETERIGEYGCGYCLGVIMHPFSTYPDACPHCKIKFCCKCGSALTPQAQEIFCYGCGTVKPESRARINRTSNFSWMYMIDEWQRDNQGRGSDGIYLIGTSCVEPDKGVSYLYKRGEDGKAEKLRPLTPEEKDVLRKHDESRQC
jgi:hypothetical protein